MSKINDNLNRSLVAALAYCDLKSLPKKDSKDYYWLKALGLVSKADGTKSYVLLRMDTDFTQRVIKDFGTISTIVSVDEVYPFYMLQEKWIPVFKTQKKEDRLEWLRRIGDKADYSELTLKALEKIILGHAVQMAWNDIKNR